MGSWRFAVIAQGTPMAGSAALAERIRARIAGEPLTAMLPAGVPGTSEALVSAADGNLYAAIFFLVSRWWILIEGARE